jgi:hypothetical protein
MKKMGLLLMFLLLPVVCCAQPSISFDNENYDFGTISGVDSLEHTFEFRNSGDKELIIEKLVPS